jgi:hypothetical protein
MLSFKLSTVTRVLKNRETIHELTRGGTKAVIRSRCFVCVRGSSYSYENRSPFFPRTVSFAELLSGFGC